MLTKEKNFRRKAHRVNLPVKITIGGRSYRTHDWSVSGVGIQDFDRPLEAGETIEAVISLPMEDAQIDLRVMLSFVARHGDVSGFCFEKIAPRTRQILRHYIELAVEGRLDHVEDLIAVVTSPEIPTPIGDALNLSDLEEENLLARFRTRSRLALLVALAFFVLLVATLFYNTTYRVAGNGVVGGNLRSLDAGVDGTVTRLDVASGDPVLPGKPLLVVRDERYDAEIAAKLTRIHQLEYRLSQLPPEDAPASALIDELQAMVDRRARDLERARKLYEARVISFKDKSFVENQYHQARIDLARQRETRARARTLSSAERRHLETTLADLKGELEQLRRRGASHTVSSPVPGRVFSTPVRAGQRVSAGTPVISIQEDRPPYVLLKLPNRDALKLSPGMKAEILVPFSGRRYRGTVEAFGYSAVNNDVPVTQEASLNETLVKIILDDDRVRLPPNLRVEVWIRTFEWPWRE